MKTYFLILLFLFIFLFANIPVVNAQEAQSETYFNKLSKALVGQPPSREEWDRFMLAKKNSALPQFIENYIDDAVLRTEFNRKLKFKLDELLRFIPQKLYVHDKIVDNVIYGLSSYDFLANEVIEKNLPWKSLLTLKNYKTDRLRSGGISGSEIPFYSYLNGSLVRKVDVEALWANSSPLPPLVEFIFPPQDLRLSGLISTPRFLARYGDTALNKNRRRAAAIFRIFLCDSMVAAIPMRNKGDESTDFDVLIPNSQNHKDVTEEELRKSFAQSDIHGTSPDCRACHYKLDPMGETLSLSPAAMINEEPSPGALTYQRNNGSMVQIAVKGLGELGQAITEQPEYLQCQVDHFWSWYVGKDSPRSSARNEQLLKKFIETQGRPKDFVKFLVHSPEFKQKPKVLSEDQLLARQVSKIFKNCTSCHEDQNENFEVKYWDMTAFPYSENPQENQGRIDLIVKALGLANKNDKRKMPPKDSVWQIGDQELGQVQNWISRGAPDYEGHPQLKTLNQLLPPPHLQRSFR